VESQAVDVITSPPFETFINFIVSFLQIGESGEELNLAVVPLETFIGPIVKTVGIPLLEQKFCATIALEKAFGIGGKPVA
jgi:hypothetical protein